MVFMIIDLLESVGYSYFITHYLSKNKYYKKGFIFILILVSFLILQCRTYYNQEDWVLIVLVALFTLIYAKILFTNRILEIIFVLLFSESMILFSNIASLLCVSLINRSDVYNILSEPSLMTMTFFYSRFLYFLIAYLLLKAKRVDIVIPSKSIIILLIIYGIILLASITGFSIFMHGKIKDNFFVVLLFLLSSLFIFIYYLYLKIKEDNIQYLNMVMMTKEQEHMDTFIHTLSSIHEQNRILRHDIKNMLLVLNQDFTDEQKTIMTELKNRTYTISTILTQNETLNMIINSKIIAHQDETIDWQFYIESELNQVDKIDLAILLGNLLDNAIESLGKNKHIQIKTKQINNMYYIKVQNSIDESVLNKNKGLKSTKANSELHGYGIKSVKRIVEKYEGNIDFIEDGNSFIVDVFLTMQK